MKTVPDRNQFKRLAADHDLVPVYRQLLSDALTPVTAFSLLDDAKTSSCLFESVVGLERVGRYSFIAIEPDRTLRAFGTRVEQTNAAGETSSEEVSDPLELLRQQVGSPRVAELPGLPPFLGGAIGFAAYDAIRYVESLPNTPHDDRSLPDLEFGFYNTIVVFDNVNKTMFVVTLVDVSTQDFDALYQQAQQRINAIVDRLSQQVEKVFPQDIGNSNSSGKEAGGLEIRSNFTKTAFCAAVETCVEYIQAGDIFQVVPSQRFEVDASVDPFEVYRSLRVINPSPFMFFLRTPSCVLVGASPEVMCRVHEDTVVVRPLAGTRRRGRDEAEDKQLAAELLQDPKEVAEHVMLVDLGRNDVGRIAKLGSVELKDCFSIEHYSHVMHISSTVEGKLAADKTYMDAFKSALPAGTVSGAPKIRAMQIIDQIEPTKRGPYGGAVGYFDYRGNTDTCIALRTMVFCNDKIYIQAGAGVVADSIAESEYEETVNKAAALISAIAAAKDRTSNLKAQLHERKHQPG